MMKTLTILIFLSLAGVSKSLVAERHSYPLDLGSHSVYITQWSKPDLAESVTRSKPATVLLLSGPTDNWNSDSAWFARLAPKLAQHYPTLSVDRAGQVLGNPDAPVGYQQLGSDLHAVIEQLKLEKIHLLAFASANLAVHSFFSQPAKAQILSLTFIDPDVLTDFSIQRYKSDAAPFKQNLEQYVAYIGEGKYNERAQQKNAQELAHLKALADKDTQTDWDYLAAIFKKRLLISSLQNTFKEIARYGEDLDAAAQLDLPRNIPLVIIDTDFEQTYIEQSEKADDIKGLEKWRSDAKTYYQQLVKRSVAGQYIPLQTREHLLPFSDPERVIDIIVRLDQSLK